MGSISNFWTSEEEAYLVENMGKIPWADIAKVIKKSTSSCYSKARALKNADEKYRQKIEIAKQSVKLQEKIWSIILNQGSLSINQLMKITNFPKEKADKLINKMEINNYLFYKSDGKIYPMEHLVKPVESKPKKKTTSLIFNPVVNGVGGSNMKGDQDGYKYHYFDRTADEGHSAEVYQLRNGVRGVRIG